MKISDFSNKEYKKFDTICELLDMRVSACGNYEQVAKHYRVPNHTVKSRFETYQGGPSKALFEWLGAEKPTLTLAEFIVVLEGIKRNDIAKAFYAE